MSHEKSQIRVYVDKEGHIVKEIDRPKIENLSFKGGGVKGTAYIGVVKALEEAGILGELKRVSGTSAGAILALFVSLGYSAEDIKKKFEATDLRDLVKGKLPKKFELGLLLNRAKEGIASLFSRSVKSQLDDGHLLLEKLREIIKEKVKEVVDTYGLKLDINYDRISFEDINNIAKMCPQSKFKELIVTGVRLNDANRGEIEYFSVDDSPKMEIATAVRISASIPYFFQPVSYEGSSYIDGGVLDNYPIHVFDQEKYKPDSAIKFRGENNQNLSSLGVRVDSDFDVSNLQFQRSEKIKKSKTLSQKLREKIKDWIVQSESSVATRAMDSRSYYTYPHQNIQVSDQGVGMADFGISEDKKRNLIDKSHSTTSDWLKLYYYNALMERKTFNSFQEMCEDMSQEELLTFSNFLKSGKEVIYTTSLDKPTAVSDNEKYYQVAMQVLQKKSGLGLPSTPAREDVFQGLLQAITQERYEIAFRDPGDRSNPQRIFKINYLENILKYVNQPNGLASANMDGRQKALILLSWVLPALKDNTSFSLGDPISYKNINKVASGYGINLKSLDNANVYATLLYSIKAIIYRLISDIEKKLQQGKKDKADKISKKLTKLIDTLNNVTQEISQYSNLSEREKSMYLLQQITPILSIKTSSFPGRQPKGYRKIMEIAGQYHINASQIKQFKLPRTSVTVESKLEKDRLVQHTQNAKDPFISGLSIIPLKTYHRTEQPIHHIKSMEGWEEFKISARRCFEKRLELEFNETNVLNMFRIMLSENSVDLATFKWEDDVIHLFHELTSEYLDKYEGDSSYVEFASDLIRHVVKGASRIISDKKEAKLLEDSLQSFFTTKVSPKEELLDEERDKFKKTT